MLRDVHPLSPLSLWYCRYGVSTFEQVEQLGFNLIEESGQRIPSKVKQFAFCAPFDLSIYCASPLGEREGGPPPSPPPPVYPLSLLSFDILCFLYPFDLLLLLLVLPSGVRGVRRKASRRTAVPPSCCAVSDSRTSAPFAMRYDVGRVYARSAVKICR